MGSTSYAQVDRTFLNISSLLSEIWTEMCMWEVEEKTQILFVYSTITKMKMNPCFDQSVLRPP